MTMAMHADVLTIIVQHTTVVGDLFLSAAKLESNGKTLRWKREAAVIAAGEGNLSALEYICDRLKAQRPVKRSKYDARWHSLMRDVCVAASKAGSVECLRFALAEQDRYRLGKVLTVDCVRWAAIEGGERCFCWLLDSWCPVDEFTIYFARSEGLEWEYNYCMNQRNQKKWKHEWDDNSVSDSGPEYYYDDFGFD